MHHVLQTSHVSLRLQTRMKINSHGHTAGNLDTVRTPKDAVLRAETIDHGKVGARTRDMASRAHHTRAHTDSHTYIRSHTYK